MRQRGLYRAKADGTFREICGAVGPGSTRGVCEMEPEHIGLTHLRHAFDGQQVDPASDGEEVLIMWTDEP